MRLQPPCWVSQRLWASCSAETVRFSCADCDTSTGLVAVSAAPTGWAHKPPAATLRSERDGSENRMPRSQQDGRDTVCSTPSPRRGLTSASPLPWPMLSGARIDTHVLRLRALVLASPWIASRPAELARLAPAISGRLGLLGCSSASDVGLARAGEAGRDDRCHSYVSTSRLKLRCGHVLVEG